MTVSQLKKRAVAPEDKTARRSAILRAAEELSARTPGFSMDQLARRAGVAKGTVYLYFGTREEVLLGVHEKQTHELFDVVERSLAASSPTGESVVRAGLRYLKAHPEFYPLAGNCRGMLDTNVSTEAAFAFKDRIAKKLNFLGNRIEELYPSLRPGEGAALLMNCYALIVGLWQQADVPVSLRAVMHRPEMQIFKIDFERQLSAALMDLWDAAARRGRS